MGPKRAIAVMAAGLALAAGASAATSRSGLHGTVMRGPITPVCKVGVPCEAPAGGVTLTFSRAGVVRETRTDQQGSYRIALPPGIYAVTTSSKPFGRTPRPARVHVRAGHSDRIAFTIDTGIR
jgi:Carboxypeptidase regulatory-like domain